MKMRRSGVKEDLTETSSQSAQSVMKLDAAEDDLKKKLEEERRKVSQGAYDPGCGGPVCLGLLDG
jgi:hypothetical protein